MYSFLDRSIHIHVHACTIVDVLMHMYTDMYMYMMQGSDVGFLPVSQSIPACDTQSKVISRLEYHIYQRCVSYDNLGEDLLFGALQDMLNPLTSTKVPNHGCTCMLFILPPPPPMSSVPKLSMVVAITNS